MRSSSRGGRRGERAGSFRVELRPTGRTRRCPCRGLAGGWQEAASAVPEPGGDPGTAGLCSEQW